MTAKCFHSVVVFSIVLCSQAASSPDGVCQDNSASWKADPELVKTTASRRPEFNYQEERVPTYTLPDALTDNEGNRIQSAAQWPARREELMEIFRSTVYGRRPAEKASVTFKQLDQLENAFDGAAIGRSMQAIVQLDGRTYTFPFVVFIPKQTAGRVPVVIHINNRYFIPLEKAASEHDPFWPVQTLIERGYATASFHTSDVDPDRADGYAEGIRGFFANGEPAADDAWRSLSAWGWAASRLLDYCSTLDRVDIARSAVVGHSRGGKSSLWAACEDTRFAIGYSNDSGCGGAAISRRRFGETVERITHSFPHWFTPNFAKYANREDQLPVDQHEVIALIAPRGVYVASADQDLWADPKGEYTSLVAAAPVFQLLGKESISDREMPALNEPRHVGRTGYHIRSGGHGLEQVDWDSFLDFADGLLQK